VKHPNTIGTPGGSVDAGESALTAALRELEEEAGLVLNRSNHNVIGSVYKHDGRAECITIVVNYTGPMTWSDGEEAWECEDIADNIVRGVRASHGHKWVTKRDLARAIDARVFLNHARPGLREAMRILG
jgi:8-oxo-dGTP pyrophosphatase MutT (NUDIX family)